MKDFSRKKVLVCPLDWGFGHATRCIPLIHQLLEQNAEVIIAAAPSIKALLQNEFPSLKFTDVFGYEVNYSRALPLNLKLILQAPRLLKLIKKENEWLDKAIDQLGLDVVISDNRYGLHSKKAHCIFITHQLFIPAPVLSAALNKKNHRYIAQFNECWVPDHEGNTNLSGKLSHGKHELKNIRYIGPLSRFKASTGAIPKKYDYCVLLSGIEPQRSILEKKLLRCITRSGKKTVFIRGIHSGRGREITNNVEVISFLNGEALREKILQSECVICRSGYSSIMDMATLGKKTILIPTPGQNEQEYLAAHLENKSQWHKVKQSKLGSLKL
ncbi:MAG: glycosyltransferase [Bacteroidia bacterium]